MSLSRARHGVRAASRRRTVTTPFPLPTDVTGLQYRWVASSIGQATGTAVASWPASTGSVALAQASSTAQPTYVTDVLSGQPVVRFDGTTDFLTAATTTQAQPVTVVMVLDLAVATQQQLIQAGSFQLFSNGGVWAVNTGTTSLTGGTPGTNATVVTLAVTGGTATLYDKGTQVISGTSGTTDLGTPLQVGVFGTSVKSRYLNGDVAEVMAYNKALSAGERATVHSYVQNRYGITVADYTP